jgi:hypothetical protein
MRPSSEVNLAIKGTLGRAQRYSGLRVVLCVFLSNHYHLLVIPDTERQLAPFMQFLNTNLCGASKPCLRLAPDHSASARFCLRIRMTGPES